MAQPITVTVLLNLKPEEADNFCDVTLPALQAQTRAFEGVISAIAVRQTANPNRVLFIDQFAAQENIDAYFAFRTSTGDLKFLDTLLTEPPLIEMWPLKAGI